MKNNVYLCETKKTDMKNHISFYFLSFVVSFFVLASCSSNTKETTADVSFYKVVEYQTFLDSVKKKNGGMNWANIDYSPESLIGKLQRKGPFTVEDTTMANEFLTKDRMPQNMSYAWIAHEDNAKTCVLVIYYSTPIYNKQLKIGEVTKREDIGEMNDFKLFEEELTRKDFRYVIPDFRLNKHLAELKALPKELKQKVEFLCNECCYYDCYDRKNCYENVSRKCLGEDCADHVCVSPDAQRGYRFSDAMKNPGFIGIEDIRNLYMPEGFRHFKIEGRSLGSAVVFEFLLYYMTKPEYHLKLREEIYLDSTLDLF